MKNITVLSVFVIISFSLNNLYSQEKANNYAFSLSPQIGFVYGQALELIYPVQGQTKGELLSELRWDMKSVFYLGIQVDFGRRDVMSAIGFISSLSFKAGIPGDSGVMEDSDWLSVENGALTHFSRHDNKTLGFFLADFSLGVSFPVKSYFYVSPLISINYTHFAFSARDGYTKYANKTGDGVYDPLSEAREIPNHGEIVRYKQSWFIPAVGFAIGTKILSPFLFNLSFKISPFAFCIAEDNHLHPSKTETYRDYLRSGFFIEPEGGVSYAFGRYEFILEFAYRFIVNAVGNTYTSVNNGRFFLEANKAGAGLSLIDSRFLLKIKL